MVDLTPFYLEFYLRNADEGYPEDARSAIGIIAKYIEQDKKLPDIAKAYLVKALRDISETPEGKKRITPKAAFKLAGKKKRKTREEELRLAQLIDGALSEGAGFNQAVEWFSETLRPAYSAAKIQAAYYKYQGAFQNPPEK